MVASGWVMVAGGDYGFARLRRKMCDFVDDLGSEKRERWVCVLVLGLFLFVILVVKGWVVVLVAVAMAMVWAMTVDI